jgi:hypothetical protein
MGVSAGQARCGALAGTQGRRAARRPDGAPLTFAGLGCRRLCGGHHIKHGRQAALGAGPAPAKARVDCDWLLQLLLLRGRRLRLGLRGAHGVGLLCQDLGPVHRLALQRQRLLQDQVGRGQCVGGRRVASALMPPRRAGLARRRGLLLRGVQDRRAGGVLHQDLLLQGGLQVGASAGLRGRGKGVPVRGEERPQLREVVNSTAGIEHRRGLHLGGSGEGAWLTRHRPHVGGRSGRRFGRHSGQLDWDRGLLLRGASPLRPPSLSCAAARPDATRKAADTRRPRQPANRYLTRQLLEVVAAAGRPASSQPGAPALNHLGHQHEARHPDPCLPEGVVDRRVGPEKGAGTHKRVQSGWGGGQEAGNPGSQDRGQAGMTWLGRLGCVQGLRLQSKGCPRPWRTHVLEVPPCYEC